MTQVPDDLDLTAPRKQKPSKRVTENGNPLAKKKSKTALPPTCTATQSSVESVTTTASSNLSAAVSRLPPPCAQPHTQRRAATDTDRHTEEPSTEPELIEVSDSNSMESVEDDDAELGACHHVAFVFESQTE
jgi:hypothetical protein